MNNFYLDTEYTYAEVVAENLDALEILEVNGGWKVFTDAQDLETWFAQE